MVSAEFETFEPQLRRIAEELDQIEGDIALLEGFSGTRDEHRQLSDSIREQHRAAERLIENMELDMDNASEEEKHRISQLRIRAHSTQRSFRRAMLQYTGNATREAQRDRALLLSGAATPAELRKRKVRTGNATLNAAADVTTALQETVSMMNDEIDKSVGNIVALKDSSATLKRAKDRYITMHDVLKTSGNLIRALEQADAVDRWLMLAGLVLFALVSFNILRKRLWIPGLYTAFRIARYLFTLGIKSSVGGLPAESSAALLATASLGSVSLAAASSAALTTIGALSLSATTVSTSSTAVQQSATLESVISEGYVTNSAMTSSSSLDEPGSESTVAEEATPVHVPPFTRQRQYKPPVERESHLEL
ncbi:Vesicle transport protein S20 [Coemansia erecta]|nr:Vesicle transport protein S20 [Coemansia erecta]